MRGCTTRDLERLRGYERQLLSQQSPEGTTKEPRAALAPVCAPTKNRSKSVDSTPSTSCEGSKAMKELMDMVGMEDVKEKAFQIYTSLQATKTLSTSSRVDMTLNFAFVGNSGTVSLRFLNTRRRSYSGTIS